MWEKWFDRINSQAEVNALLGTIDMARIPRHVAIIMDGNGRWAQKRGLPRLFGHRAGAEALREIVKMASMIGIKVLTTYAFSTENWKRPVSEVDFLMGLLSEYIDREVKELQENNVQIRFIGDLTKLATELQRKIAQTQAQTAANTGLILVLAVNYGGRAEIARAVRALARKCVLGLLNPEEVTERNLTDELYTADLPDPDLLIRPSGDLRLSNFLLWQAAYAEFWFSKVNWPDFKPVHLLEAVVDYQQRERRFGGLKNKK